MKKIQHSLICVASESQVVWVADRLNRQFKTPVKVIGGADKGSLLVLDLWKKQIVEFDAFAAGFFYGFDCGVH